jgi:hypothetical protein
MTEKSTRMADKPSVKLEQLRGLAATPDVQAAYAVRLLKDRTVDVVLAAIRVLAPREDPTVRAAFLSTYTTLAANGVRRDPGGTLRIALLDAIQPIADGTDTALFERAASTYEFLYGEAAGDLRAAGLRALASVDAELAGYYAVRLLDDPYQSIMSGEPSVAAMKVLAAHNQHLPIYAYVLREAAQHPDVLAEGLRSLTDLPPSLLPALVERYRISTSEIVLLGFFEMLLGHRQHMAYRDVVLDFLATTTYYNLYRYLLIMLLNTHDPQLEKLLTALAQNEFDRQKRAVWDEVWTLHRRGT